MKKLAVHAGPGAEITIANQDFSIRERNLCSLTADLPPDLYTITVRAGGRAIEHELIVTNDGVHALDAGVAPKRSGNTFTINIAPPSFVTASPLAESKRSHETQGRLIRDVSAKPRRVRVRPLEKSGEILLSARAFNAAKKRPKDLTKFRILDRDGEVVADLADGTHQTTGDPAVACSVVVSPGWYRIEIARTGHPKVEQSVIVCEGWQTQVFVLRELAPRDRMRLSMMMRRVEAGTRPRFHADDADARMTELALVGLARGRAIISPEELANDKFRDPMLGIYAAHLLPSDSKMLATVVKNLRRLVGNDHPDVEALALRHETLASSARINDPPMLTAGWRAIVKRSVTHPAIVPATSVNAKVATQLYGAGIWLWWKAGVLEAEEAAPPPSPMQSAMLRVLPTEPRDVIQALNMPRLVVEGLARNAKRLPTTAKPANKAPAKRVPANKAPADKASARKPSAK